MSDNLRRLGEFVRLRRTELLLRQEDVTRAGGPSNSSQTKLESGRLKRINTATLDKLDHALQWVPGSARAVLNGGEPTRIAGTRQEPPSQRHSSILDAISADTALSDRDKAALYDQYLEMLRSYGRRAFGDDSEDSNGDHPSPTSQIA